jgi:hypothetical protein
LLDIGGDKMTGKMYRLVSDFKTYDGTSDRETIADYLDYEEILNDYEGFIKRQTDSFRMAEFELEPFYIIKKDHVSNPGGEWHWCNLKNDEGDIWNLRIETIGVEEAEYFASEDIEMKYKALYVSKEESFLGRFLKKLVK